MLIFLALKGLFATISALSCFSPNTTVNILLNKHSLAITVWPLPLNHQTADCSILQGTTGMTATATVGSYTFSSISVPFWSMEQPNLLTFTCPTDKTATSDCQTNLTGSTVVQVELNYASSKVSLVTTNVYYTLTNNSACWTDPRVSVDYFNKEICFLVTPSDCDLPKDTNLQNTYEAFMLIHLDTLPDAYLNVTLSSHGTNAQLPNFIRPYTHNLVTQFCYSCNGVRYPGNDWLTNSNKYDRCIELIDILKVETAWSATLIVYVPIPGTTKSKTPTAVSSSDPQVEVVTPSTVAQAGIVSAVKASAGYSKCYKSVIVQVYFGVLAVLLERDSASICNDLIDYRKIVVCGELTTAQDTSLLAPTIRISLENSNFTFKQTKQFLPCTTVTCLRDMNRLLAGNLSLTGSFTLQYFSGKVLPETIIPYPGSVQRTCFSRATLVVATNLAILRPIGRSPAECPVAEGMTEVTLDIYIHSGTSISAITLERLFVRMSGETEYKRGKELVFTCDTMYQRGVYSSENVPKQDIEYYVTGNCSSKLKSVLEAYKNGTGVYAETSFRPTDSGAPAADTHKEYQYIFIKESYFESGLISASIAATVLICGIIVLTMTYAKGYIMEP